MLPKELSTALYLSKYFVTQTNNEITNVTLTNDFKYLQIVRLISKQMITRLLGNINDIKNKWAARNVGKLWESPYLTRKNKSCVCQQYFVYFHIYEHKNVFFSVELTKFLIT